MKQWFEDWFDSPLYYELYAARNEADAVRLLQSLQTWLPAPGAPVLDLACGRGRHALNLAALGYRVTGVDLSPGALEFAAQESARRNLAVSWIRGDMRNPLPGRYAAVVNLFTSFGYFDRDEENRLVFARVAAALEPGGRFILDYLNPVTTVRNLVPMESGAYSGGRYRIERFIQNGCVHKNIRIAPAHGASPLEFTESVRLLPAAWFERAARDAGLEPAAWLGDYDGGVYNGETSPRCIGVFEKSNPA